MPAVADAGVDEIAAKLIGDDLRQQGPVDAEIEIDAGGRIRFVLRPAVGRDAVAAVDGHFEPYAGRIRPAGGSPVVAAAKAAHDVLVNRFPAQTGLRIADRLARWIGPWTSRHQLAKDNLRQAFPERDEAWNEFRCRDRLAQVVRGVLTALLFVAYVAPPEPN